MQERDRERFAIAFDKLCLVLDKRLDTATSAKLTAAYWTALNRMDVSVFERSCERACETLDRFPKPGQLWTIARELRAEAGASARQEAAAKPVGDALHGYANRVLFWWLWDHTVKRGPLDPGQLTAVIRAKDEMLAQYRMLIAEHDPDATDGRFRRLFEEQANRLAA